MVVVEVVVDVVVEVVLVVVVEVVVDVLVEVVLVVEVVLDVVVLDGVVVGPDVVVVGPDVVVVSSSRRLSRGDACACAGTTTAFTRGLVQLVGMTSAVATPPIVKIFRTCLRSCR